MPRISAIETFDRGRQPNYFNNYVKTKIAKDGTEIDATLSDANETLAKLNKQWIEYMFPKKS